MDLRFLNLKFNFLKSYFLKNVRKIIRDIICLKVWNFEKKLPSWLVDAKALPWQEVVWHFLQMAVFSCNSRHPFSQHNCWWLKHNHGFLKKYNKHIIRFDLSKIMHRLVIFRRYLHIAFAMLKKSSKY